MGSLGPNELTWAFLVRLPSSVWHRADDNSTFVRVIDWWPYYLNQYWLSSMEPYSVIRPQWFKHLKVITCDAHPWASYQIRKIACCAWAGNAWNVSPATDFKRKPLVSDPGMHHATCVTHVPWCMSGSLTRGGGENVPGIPGACATRNFTYLLRGT